MVPRNDRITRQLGWVCCLFVLSCMLSCTLLSAGQGPEESETRETEAGEARMDLAAVQSETPTESPPATETCAPAPEAGDTRLRGKDGMVEVYIPAGSFMMGSTEEEIDQLVARCEVSGDCKRAWLEVEIPQHGVTVDGFWIDQTEVTHTMYDRCVETGACTGLWYLKGYTSEEQYNRDPQKDDHPAAPILWSMAHRYCSWVGGRLPTEAEWEWAARGEDGRIYPWGDEEGDGTQANFCDASCPLSLGSVQVNDGFEAFSPVGSYPAGASPFGVLDMSGNVWEWVQDCYDPAYYAVSPELNLTGPAETGLRVIRGGSWINPMVAIRVTTRSGLEEGQSPDDVGFRCVHDN